MRVFTFALACLAVLTSCRDHAACRPGSLFVHLDTSSLPAGVDTIHAQLTLANGNTLAADVPFHTGSGLELTFASGDYPGGTTIGVVIQAISSGVVVASASQASYAVPSGCGTLTLSFMLGTPMDLASAADLGAADSGATDLSRISDLASRDLASYVDLASVDLTPVIGLVQAGPVTTTQGVVTVTPGLPAASTPGTMLFASVAGFEVPNTATQTMPAGWIMVGSYNTNAQDQIETWFYPNNPGNITSVTYTLSSTSASTLLHAAVSEWSGGLQSVDTVGFGGNTSFTTGFSVMTSTVPTGKLGIAAFATAHPSPGPATLTPQSGWTNVANDGLGNHEINMTVDYLIESSAVAPLSEIETITVSGEWAAVISTFK